MKVAQQAEADITTTTTFLACKRVDFQLDSLPSRLNRGSPFETK